MGRLVLLRHIARLTVPTTQRPSFLRSVLTADCGQTIRRAEADTSITLRAVVRGPPRAVLHINSSETPGNDGKEENLALGSAGKTADD